MSDESDSKICQHTDDIVTSLKDTLKNNNVSLPSINISDLKSSAKATGDKAIADIMNKNQGKIKTIIDFITGDNASRPDLVFLAHVLVFIVALIIVFLALPYVTGTVKVGFNQEQFIKATKLPASAYNLEEMAKVNMNVKAFTDHKAYFNDGGPYSDVNSGLKDLTRANTAIPMLVFFLQFVLPPLALGYIIWFVYTYFKYVYQAAWGWFLTLYDYFTTLIEGRLGCKWYIRFVTGWDCETPQFGAYVARWKKKYIDQPVYYEQLKYIAEYKAAKEKYITAPFKSYISDPLNRTLIKAEYLQKVYIDRTFEVALKKIRDSYNNSTVFNWSRLLGNVHGGLTKDMLTKGYESNTITGDTCECPATIDTIDGKISQIKDTAAHLSDTATDAKETIAATIKDMPRSCDIAEATINNRASLMGSLLLLIILMFIIGYVYTWTYGTPVIVKNLISPIHLWTSKTLVTKQWSYLPYIVAATTIAIIVHTGWA